jgi:hypothetical protein
LVCNAGSEKGGGNASRFIRMLWEECDKTTANYDELAKERKLLYADTLIHWEVVYSPWTKNWLVPGYNADHTMTQLYRYTLVDGKRRLLPTPTLGHQLHGVNLYDASCTNIYLCEGPWDGMALWEVLGQCKRTEQGLIATGSREKSLLGDACVLAVPGCNTFMESWLPLFSGKVVHLLYDSDHPRINEKTGKPVAPAGLTGLQRVAKILSEASEPPAEIHYLQWGANGYDPSLPSGYDVRDWLAATA